jgi:transposase
LRSSWTRSAGSASTTSSPWPPTTSAARSCGREGNGGATARRFFKQIGKGRSGAIEVISLDMSRGYAKAASEHAPQATVAIDPCHMVALGNRALDQVRRDYSTNVRQTGDRTATRRFQGARSSLLKAPQTLSGDQTATLGGSSARAAKSAPTRFREHSARSLPRR